MTDLDLQPPRRPPRALARGSQVLIAAGIGVIAAVIFGASWLFAEFRPQEPKPESASGDAPGSFRPTPAQWAALKVSPVRSMPFKSERRTEGNIAYNDDATTPVFSPYSGRVTALMAKLGDVVHKGQPLFAIEATEFVQEQNDLVAGLSALSAAQAQFALSEANEKRQHQLYLIKAAALKDWLQSQADLAAASSGLRNAENALEAARGRLRILGLSSNQVKQIESNPQTHKMTPATVVVAPISGTVTQRQIGLGQYITSAATGASSPVYAISNLSTVWLIAHVRETDAPLIRLSEPIAVQVLAYPGKIFNAKITWIAPAVDPATHRLQVRAEVQNRDGALKPMMFANFDITTSESIDMPGVPESAVIYEGEDARVYVARDDGTLLLRAIRTGRINKGLVEVTSGLASGEKIVTSGTLFIDRAARS